METLLRTLPATMHARIARLIEAAVGPAPWYWKTFPSFSHESRTWSWRLDPPTATLGGSPVLQSDWDGVGRFAIGFYGRPVSVGNGRFLVWRPGGRSGIDVRVFRCERLRALRPARLEPNRDAVAGRAVERLRIGRLEPGTHTGFNTRTPVDLDEILLLAHREATRDTDPALAIYQWRPQSGHITVLPQIWFTPATHDLGYEWVTRVVRDPETGRIVGDGIRIPAFELADDGMTLRGLLVERSAAQRASD